MWEISLLVSLGILAMLIWFYTRQDDNDRKMEVEYDQQMKRQRARMAEQGDKESQLMEFAETGKLPPLKMPVEAKRKPGRPKKVA